MTDPTRDPRASYLSPPDFHRLDWACAPIHQAYGTPPYLVGSVLTRPDYRDIDIRLILPDDDVERMFPTDGIRLLTNVALSDLIATAAHVRAPVDFQVQSMTEANVPGHGMRNPLGIRNLAAPHATVGQPATVESPIFCDHPRATRQVRATAGGRHTVSSKTCPDCPAWTVAVDSEPMLAPWVLRTTATGGEQR